MTNQLLTQGDARPLKGTTSENPPKNEGCGAQACGKVLEFECSIGWVRVDREIRSARVELGTLVRNQDYSCRWRRVTLGPPSGDLVGDLLQFKKQLIAPFDAAFIEATEEALDQLWAGNR